MTFCNRSLQAANSKATVQASFLLYNHTEY